MVTVALQRALDLDPISEKLSVETACMGIVTPDYSQGTREPWPQDS